MLLSWIFLCIVLNNTAIHRKISVSILVPPLNLFTGIFDFQHVSVQLEEYSLVLKLFVQEAYKLDFQVSITLFAITTKETAIPAGKSLNHFQADKAAANKCFYSFIKNVNSTVSSLLYHVDIDIFALQLVDYLLWCVGIGNNRVYIA